MRPSNIIALALVLVVLLVVGYVAYELLWHIAFWLSQSLNSIVL